MEIFGWDVPLWMAGLVILFTILYLYGTRNSGKLEALGIPVVPPWPFMGSVLFTWKSNGHLEDMKNFQKLGKVWGYYDGRNPILCVADVEMVKQILVKDFDHFSERRIFSVDGYVDEMMDSLCGEKWKVVRSGISPIFTSSKLRHMSSLMLECADNMIANLKKRTAENAEINTRELYGALGMEVIATCAFGIKLNSVEDPNNPFILKVKGLMELAGSDSPFSALFVAFPFLIKQLLERYMLPALKYFEETIKTVMTKRRESGERRGDLVDIIMELEKQVESPTYKRLGITSHTIMMQAVEFLMAGYDTTSLVLTYTSYYLALHPDVQERLVQEIDASVEKHGGKVSYDVIQDLPYLDAVISESLRLTPPIYRHERLCTKDWSYGDLTIKKGSLVQIPVYVIHHDPQHFPDPYRFDPERFSPEKKSSINQYAYMPFGAGPRICIAFRFGLEDVKLTLASVLREYRLEPSANTKIPLDFISGNPFVLFTKSPVLNFVPQK